MTITQEDIARAGVVGAGGAGFPTHVKLSGKADTVVLNAAECEPLLHKDKELIRNDANKIVEGLARAVALVGAKEAVIGIKEKYKDVVPYVAMRSFMMMFVSNTIADSRLADLTIDLDTVGSSVYDMTKLKELFFRGYESAVKALEAAGYERKFPREEIRL